MATVQIRSHSDPTVEYTVDPDAGTCTCPHSTGRLKAENAKDGGDRVCKHVEEARENALEAMDAPPAQTPEATSEDLVALLNHPDPDPDLLPSAIPISALTLASQVEHLLRCSKRAEAKVAELTKRMAADMRGWAEDIAREQAKVKGFRQTALAWMQNNGVTKLSNPFISVYIMKGKTKVVVDDAARAITALKEIGASSAYETVEQIKKEEFDTYFNARPDLFAESVDPKTKVVLAPAIAHEETGDPVLVVKGKR